MSLSVASNVASHGRSFAYGLAGMSTAAAPHAAAPQRPAVAPSWSWTPNATEPGRRNTQVAVLMGVLAQIPVPDPDDRSGIAIPQEDAKDDLTSLDERARSTVSSIASPSETSLQIDPLQTQGISQAAPSDGTAVTSGGSLNENQSAADGSAAAAEVKLEALFKTLQAYGL